MAARARTPESPPVGRRIARLTALAGILLGALGAPEAGAEGRQTRADARAMVERAVSYIREHGRERGFAEIDRGPRAYNAGDLYVFVYDYQGRCLAHARRPHQVGINLWNHRGFGGRKFVRDWVRVAREQGSGWVSYRYAHERTGRVLEKNAYIVGLDGYLVGASAFIYSD